MLHNLFDQKLMILRFWEIHTLKTTRTLKLVSRDELVLIQRKILANLRKKLILL